MAAQTVLGDQIRAQAAYIRASGLYLESAAEARKINAEAVAVEIENSVKSVETYWNRKSIWEEEYRKRNPNHMEREKRLQEVFRRRIREQYIDLMKTDVSEQLNWLLRELSTTALAIRYDPRAQEADSQMGQLNGRLTERDKGQIWLNDGGRGSKLVFCLAEPKPLETRWPVGLRVPEFKEAREEFESAREAALAEIHERKGVPSYESGQRLIKATNGLLTTLDEAYPHERLSEPAEFLEYLDAKRYLQMLLSGVLRTIKTSDRSLFENNLQFHGETLLDLIEYMYRNGLLFSKPVAGGEGVYNKLFLGMRNMYVVFGADKPGGGSEKVPLGSARILPGDTIPAPPRAPRVN
jgi:hypothetical protein